MQYLKKLDQSEPGYVFQEFPKWKYHPQKKALIVPNREAEEALGADWYDTPTEAAKAMEKVVQKLRILEAEVETKT